MRRDGRQPADIRPVEIVRRFTSQSPGSVLIRCGGTHVLCTASIVEDLPKWRQESAIGWLTAEYDMLPGSTGKRRDRSRARVDGRTHEIQRLIGRSLRAVVDLAKLGPRSIYIDCDVLQADGGTRTAAVSGAYVALCDAVAFGHSAGFWTDNPINEAVAAISVGLVRGAVLVDLDYSEDVAAEVDCNLVMTGGGRWIEVQATGERATMDDAHLRDFLELGRRGIERMMAAQQAALAGA